MLSISLNTVKATLYISYSYNYLIILFSLILQMDFSERLNNFPKVTQPISSRVCLSQIKKKKLEKQQSRVEFFFAPYKFRLK